MNAITVVISGVTNPETVSFEAKCCWGDGGPPGAGAISVSSCATAASTRCSSNPPEPAPPVTSPPSCRLLAAAAARHGEPELRLGRARGELADDLALVDHEDAVGERQDLLQLERDELDAAPGVALLDEAAVDELDRADV